MKRGGDVKAEKAILARAERERKYLRSIRKKTEREERKRSIDRAKRERDGLKEQRRKEQEEIKREKARVAEQRRKEQAEAKREKARMTEQRRKEQEEKKRELEEFKEKRREAKYDARQKIYRKIKSKLKNDSRGFGYSNYGFLPRAELTVCGDGASVAARLAADGITVKECETDGGFSRFKIRKKDLNKAVAILNDLCYNFEVGESYGIGRLGAFLLARSGVIIGAVAAAIALNISYSHIWRIDISGNSVLSDAAVERVLRDSGFVSGVRKSKVDVAAVCAAVNGMAGVSDAGAEIIGTTLFVYVLEAKDFTVHGKAEAYESAYDATVTRIVMRNGTARVKRGDVVKRGDLLADGDVYSTGGELLYSGFCDADVYGEVSLAFSAEISAVAVEYKRTGRSDRQTCFSVFGFKMFKPSSPFKSYESVVRTANYDVLLPLYVTTYEFFETKPVEVERDIDAAAREFAADKAKELEFVGDFKTSYSVKATERGTYRVNLFLGGEALISKGAPRRIEPPPTGD